MVKRVVICAVLTLAAAVAGGCQDSTRWQRQHDATEAGALRPPPRPPRCDAATERRNIALANGRPAPVRVYRFRHTLLYIPLPWVFAAPRRTPRDLLGVYDPDVIAGECPGVVHQVTDGGLYLARFADVPVGVAAAKTIASVHGRATFLDFQKLRREEQAYPIDRLIDSKTHEDEDSLVHVADDVAIRLDWRPASLAETAWRARVIHWRPAGRIDPRHAGAWGKLVGSPDWNAMVVGLKALTRWLETPPNRRDPAKRFTL